MLERHDLPVHLGPDTMVSDLGMNRECKIDGSRSSRQLFHNPFGREHIDHIVKEVEFHRVHELPVIRQVFMPFDELVEPAEGLAVTICHLSLFFILPMGSDAVFGDTMHFFCADLEFDVLPLRAHHCRM